MYDYVGCWLETADFEKIRQKVNGRKVYIWGNENTCLRIKDAITSNSCIDVCGFVDNFRKSGLIDTVPVLTGDELPSCQDAFVILTNRQKIAKQMKIQLKEKGYMPDRDYIWIIPKVSLNAFGMQYCDAYGNMLEAEENDVRGIKVKLKGYQNKLYLGHRVKCKNGSLLIKMHGKAEIFIGSGCEFRGECVLEVWDGALHIDEHCFFEDSNIQVVAGNCQIGAEGRFIHHIEFCCVQGEMIIGKVCIIYKESKLIAEKEGKIFIGDKCTMERNSIIIAPPHSCIEIGEDSMLSFDVSIWGNNGHALIDPGTHENVTLRRDNSMTSIGKHVWIGNKATLLSCHIGDNSVIGASSLVKGNIESNVVAAGNPAKVIHRGYTWYRNIDYSEGI